MSQLDKYGDSFTAMIKEDRLLQKLIEMRNEADKNIDEDIQIDDEVQ